MDKKFKEIIEYISVFLVDATGNEIFEKWKEKRKISKILNDDKKYVKRIFNSVYDSDIYNLIENFILFKAFKDESFYSPVDLTSEQEESLWKIFCEFIRTETANNYVNNEYKRKIIQCINFHNKAINNIILDYKDIVHMKATQNQNKDINNSLNRIFNTLNTETKLQNDDYELNFSVEQLEKIMKSYRYDINQLRKNQIIYLSLFVILFITCVIWGFSEYNLLIEILELFALVLFLRLWINIKYQIERIESKMEQRRDELWEIHYKLFANQIKNKYKINKKKKT